MNIKFWGPLVRGVRRQLLGIMLRNKNLTNLHLTRLAQKISWKMSDGRWHGSATCQKDRGSYWHLQFSQPNKSHCSSPALLIKIKANLCIYIHRESKERIKRNPFLLKTRPFFLLQTWIYQSTNLNFSTRIRMKNYFSKSGCPFSIRDMAPMLELRGIMPILKFELSNTIYLIR